MLVSLVGNLGFYLINMWTLRPLINSVYLLFGGLLFPLNLLGNKIYKIVDKNPFAIVGFNFTRAMQGKLTIEELIFYIILSFSWFILFFVLYKITYYFSKVYLLLTSSYQTEVFPLYVISTEMSETNEVERSQLLFVYK